MTVKEFIKRFDNGESFSRTDLMDLFNGDIETEADDDCEFEIDVEYGENRRWSRMEYRIHKFNNRYFSCCADIGLTEMQDNEYWAQPEEVAPVEKLVTVIEWHSIK